MHCMHGYTIYIYIYNIIRTLYVCFHPVYAQACHPIEVLSWPSLHPAAGRAPSLSQQSGHKLLHPLPGCHNSKPYWEMLTYYLVLTSLTPNRRITPLQAPWSKAAVEKNMFHKQTLFDIKIICLQCKFILVFHSPTHGFSRPSQKDMFCPIAATCVWAQMPIRQPNPKPQLRHPCPKPVFLVVFLGYSNHQKNDQFGG